MIETPEITTTKPLRTAVIRFEIPKDQIQHVMGPGMQELFATVGAQNVAPVGPAFSHHFRIDADVWDFEIGVPVETPIEPAGRVVPGELPATKVARSVYRGGYEGLGLAWGELDGWIREQGRTAAQGLWEFYTAGPETGSDESQYRTELNRPLVD